jgi:hypothetical protein
MLAKVSDACLFFLPKLYYHRLLIKLLIITVYLFLLDVVIHGNSHVERLIDSLHEDASALSCDATRITVRLAEHIHSLGRKETQIASLIDSLVKAIESSTDAPLQAAVLACLADVHSPAKLAAVANLTSSLLVDAPTLSPDARLVLRGLLSCFTPGAARAITHGDSVDRSFGALVLALDTNAPCIPVDGLVAVSPAMFMIKNFLTPTLFGSLLEAQVWSSF